MAMLHLISTAAGIVRNHYLELANQTPYYRAANQTSDKDRNIESTPPPVDTYEPTIVEPDSLTLVSAVEDQYIERDPAVTDVVDEAVPDENSDEATDVTYRFRHHTHYNHEVRLAFQLEALAHAGQPQIEPTATATGARSGRA